MVIVAPTFTSVGVTLVINGCNDFEGGDGSGEFVQPVGRVIANNATTDKKYPIVLDGMVFSPQRLIAQNATATTSKL
jgi:hypothetical protein